MAFKLNKALQKQVDQLANDLSEALDEMRSEYDEKSERWQEGDRAAAVDTWFDEIEAVMTELQSLDAEPSY